MPRVRVFNDAESRREKFTLQWTGPDWHRRSATRSTSTSRPARAGWCACPATRAPATVQAIVLKGDAAPFDNTLYVMDEPREEATVLFIGDDRPDDPTGLLFYLMRVFIDTPRRTVKVVAQAAVGSRFARSRRTGPRW